jgi:cardiolipin synthase A/B
MLSPINPVAAIALQWTITLVLSIRILLHRRSHGSALAWIMLTLALPYIGAVLYLVVGEIWLPRNRTRRVAALIRAEKASRARTPSPSPSVPSLDGDLIRVLSAQASSASGGDLTDGNDLELLVGAESSFARIVIDIDAATRSCFVLTYIWHPGGLADGIADALVRAARRGVDCRVLADALGSSPFLDSDLSRQLRDAGVRVFAANPASWLRLRLARIDLRNHRKILTIDGRIGYTGSLNIADPACFKRDAGVGRWVDCIVRVAGPAAADLELLFLRDWRTELPGPVPSVVANAAPEDTTRCGGCTQIVPSGPAQDPVALRQMLLTLIYSARHRVVITTPYFVPDDAMLSAITSVAKGGVKVQLVIPAKCDSIMVQHAMQSYFRELLARGVEIHRFTPGLLHSKTVTVDGAISMIGTANMDLRSFELNLEVSMFIYDSAFAASLLRLQESYIAQSRRLEAAEWRNRPRIRNVLDNAAQLVAPIL